MEALLKKALKAHRSKKWGDAKKTYEKILAAHKNHALSWMNLGLVEFELGKGLECLKAVDRGIQLAPNNPNFHYNKGYLCYQTQEFTQAIACYKTALSLQPRDPHAWYQLGRCYTQLGDHMEALKCYQQAGRLDPNVAIFNSLGNAFFDMDELQRSLECFQQAIKIDPSVVASYGNCGIVFKKQGRYKEAIEAFRMAMKDDNRLSSINAYSLLTYCQRSLCEWDDLYKNPDALQSQIKKLLKQKKLSPVSPFHAFILGWPLSLQLEIVNSYAGDVLRNMANIKKNLNFSFKRDKKKKLRLGYLSSDYHEHATCHLINGLWKHHNKDAFEVYVYSYGQPSGSDYRQEILRHCDNFKDIRTLSLKAMAETIYEDGIDILVEMKGYTENSRIEVAALRPAPIIVASTGFLSSYGKGIVDYLIADKTVIPEEEGQIYPEAMVYMPGWWCITDDEQVIGEDSTRTHWGLPDDKFIFCDFNSNYKIEPNIFETWMTILKKVPESVLWLFKKDDNVDNNLKNYAKKAGVDPERLIFSDGVKKSEHLARLKCADLFLDTQIVCGHTTAIDALYVGLPLLALPGPTSAGRVSASALKVMGLPELIASDREDYIQKAVNYAKDPNVLTALREKVKKAKNTTLLFNTKKYVQDLEKAYTIMWQQYMDEENPVQIDIP